MNEPKLPTTHPLVTAVSRQLVEAVNHDLRAGHAPKDGILGEHTLKVLAEIVSAAAPNLLPQTPEVNAALNPGHPDDDAVDAFAAEMKFKLARKRRQGYTGWNTYACTDAQLAHMLLEHVPKGDPIDIANFCMMLHQRNVEHPEVAVKAISDEVRRPPRINFDPGMVLHIPGDGHG